MKLFAIVMLLWAFCCQAENGNVGNVCLHIPERGTETNVIQKNCKKGDIIQLNKRLVAYLCDFDKAIVHYDGGEQFVCAFLGGKRTVREGTNP